MKFNSGTGWESSKSNLSEEEYQNLKEMLDECQVHLALYNGWEEEFMNDMIIRIDERKPLSVKQREIIGSLHNKVTRRR